MNPDSNDQQWVGAEDEDLDTVTQDRAIRIVAKRLGRVERNTDRTTQLLEGYGGRPGIVNDVQQLNARVDALEKDKQRLIGAALLIGLIWTSGTVGLSLYLAHR